MKILHTSDWHLGHSLYNYDRGEEQSHMIKQIIAIVEQEKPDVFLLCGDLYHTAQPSNSVQTLMADALTMIHNANPSMTIVTTAGNHDSGSKHEIFKSPWLQMNVYAIGNIEKEPENWDDYIVDCECMVVAIPYCYERNMPEDVWQRAIDVATERNKNNKPIVMMAHTTVRGCDSEGHEDVNDYMVGGIDGIELASMGKGYDYLALGHIHHAQWVRGGDGRVRYSGSPIAVNFDERYEHSVTIVEIAHHNDTPKTKIIPIENIHPLVTLPTEGTATWDDAKELLKAYPNDIASYIRLNVAVDNVLPSEANAEALSICKEKACRFCHINVQRIHKEGIDEREIMSISEFKQESPRSMLLRYLKDVSIENTEELLQLFDEAESLTIEESRQIED